MCAIPFTVAPATRYVCTILLTVAYPYAGTAAMRNLYSFFARKVTLDFTSRAYHATTSSTSMMLRYRRMVSADGSIPKSFAR